jgi:oxalate decarboxylase/phosphoglucose isomerase-like protein (cupin superfamily)
MLPLPASDDAETWRLIEMPKVVDHRGNLTAIEGGDHLPFQIARVYYVYDVPSGSSRAAHAHKALHQFILALSGSFCLHLDDGTHSASVALNRPNVGLYLPPGVWRRIDNFSGGAVCLVLASDRYREADYIRTYDEFLAHVRNQPRSAKAKGSAAIGP